MPLQRTKPITTEPRDVVFISHATPDDNDLARWLSFRLMREGYRVWVDLEELKGGEDWWRDIERAIRKRVAKFLVCISRKSNDREGVLKETRVASVVGREQPNFIVPLRVDDLPFTEFNIEVARFTGVDFSTSWASGFAQLLDVLKRANVPKPIFHGADAACDRWDLAFAGRGTVHAQDETLVSNWLPVDGRTDVIWWHERDGTLGFEGAKFLPAYPVFEHGRYFLSFASAEDLAPAFEAADSKINKSASIKLSEFVRSGLAGLSIDKNKARDIQMRLLRLSIDAFLASRGLARYEMSNGKACYWFSIALVGTSRFKAKRPNGSEASRALVGTAKGHSWHFAVELRPAFRPFDLLTFVPHVVFSDADVVISSTSRQHSLRRTVCKQWFNDQWSDRIAIALARLSDDQGNLVIPLGGKSNLTASATPVLFQSPVTYTWGAIDVFPEDGERVEAITANDSDGPDDDDAATDGEDEEALDV